MVFNSIPFYLFFISFFFLYWFAFNKSAKIQNVILLLGSYVFYSWADWRFSSFLMGVSALNFLLGIYIEKEIKYKRLLLYIGLLQGIGCLAFFKYFNFFITSFNDIFHFLNVNLQTLNIIIPLGISFFTFRTVSYILDIYRGKINATKDWIVFFNYVSFFPSLLSGPIDKAKLFIPQLEKKRAFDYNQATDGMRQILWGLFKKIVIADNCATITTQIFDNYQTLSGSTLLLGAFLYAIQVYADFSGYSDMAIGFSRLIGFNISKNFDFPYFSRNINEFWKKWHISLTSWITEYVFTPLSIAFRDLGKLGLILAIIINLTICGIWHGAKWNYVIFGFLHGCYFIPIIMMGTMNKKKEITKEGLLPSIREFIGMVSTFTLVMLTFILIRVDNIANALSYISIIFSSSLFTIPNFSGIREVVEIVFLIVIFFSIEWLGREQQYALARLGTKWKRPLRYAMYYAIMFTIFFFGGKAQQFIYFQF